MTPITTAQKTAIKRIFDRRPLFHSDMSDSQLAGAKGWSFVARENLPQEKRDNLAPQHSHVWVHPTYLPLYLDASDIVADYGLAAPMTYKQFRKSVQTGFDCLMVKWQGMWLGIEKDGYTHS